MQSFLRRDAREISHAVRGRGRLLGSALVAVQIDPERHDRDPVGPNPEQPRHRRHVVLADGDEPIDLRDLPANQIDRLAAIRFEQAIEEEILSLKRAADRTMQIVAQRSGEADEQRVRQIDDVGNRFVGEPVEQLVELLAQHAAIAFEHRDSHIAEQLRIGGNGPACERADDARRVPDPIEKPRRPAEERHVLLQVDADAAEQHALAADVGLVGIRWCVQRQERDVVAARQKLHRQRVVPRAAAAIHPRGASRDRQNLHMAATTIMVAQPFSAAGRWQT